MDRTVEKELRQDIKEINDKLTKNQLETNDKLSDIKVSLESLKTKQNLGIWVVQVIITVIIVGIGKIIR